MKLVTVLMLVALPALCYAGSGCPMLETVVTNALTPSISPSDYLSSLGSLVHTATQAEAIKAMKQHFNDNAALMANFQSFMNTVYRSWQCMTTSP